MVGDFMDKYIHSFNRRFYFLASLADLLARFWVAQVFFLSALVKIQSWSSTVMLFQYEYHVPLLPPYWAAVSGTVAELILPVLLLLGLGGRLMVAVFFIYNVIAVVSYPFLWTEEGATGLHQHVSWGLLLLLLLFHGLGKLSIDYWIEKRNKYHFI